MRVRGTLRPELGLSMQQSMALMHLNPGQPLPMGALAEAMHWRQLQHHRAEAER